MGTPASLAPARPAPALSAPSSTPGGAAPAPAEAVPSFLARYWAELGSRPARILAALMATAMAPVLVIDSAVARATAELVGRPRAETQVAPAEQAAPKQPLIPLAGDVDSWRAGASRAAATCPGLPAEVLVAIARVETGLGIRTDRSSAGALGPMQFMPATWAAYGADGDGDGRADVMNVLDALYGAARLLCANGGGDPQRLKTAVWHYNRSSTYVERVATLAGLNPWPSVD